MRPRLLHLLALLAATPAICAGSRTDWPVYGGPDNVRYSALKQIDRTNVKTLQVAWTFVCKRCGGPLKVVAYITHTVAIRRILDHLGLCPEPQEKPPPLREVLRVAEHGEGWGVSAEWD
jgi:hypothetical protein